MTMRRILGVALGAGLLFLPVLAGAAVISADLVYSNALHDGIVYGNVNVDQVDPTTVSFSVVIFTPPLIADTGFGIQKFGVNTNLVDSSGNVPYANFEYTGPAGWSFGYAGAMDEFGVFEIRYLGSIFTRQDPLFFTVRLADGEGGGYLGIVPENFYEVNGGNFHYSALVYGFSYPGSNYDHAYFADGVMVPEPGTMLLLGSGLIGMAAWGRKKYRK